jgi:hypothetical protein
MIGKVLKKNKMLLQCSIRELHKDLYTPGVGLGEVLFDGNGKPLVSDTMFRALLPPELRTLTNNYKESCCCELCCRMSYLQAALNRFRVLLLAQFEKELKKLEQSSRRPGSQRSGPIADARAKFTKYKSEAFGTDGSTLHPKSKDAAYCDQCPSPQGFVGTGVTRFQCAYGTCPSCGDYCRPTTEQECEEKHIKFYSFKNLPTCTICGALPEGSTTCTYCVANVKVENKRGKIRRRKHLALNHQMLKVFDTLYIDTRKIYKIHRFKFLVLGKKFIIDVRQKSVRPGEVCIQHDFAEALTIVHQEEVSY